MGDTWQHKACLLTGQDHHITTHPPLKCSAVSFVFFVLFTVHPRQAQLPAAPDQPWVCSAELLAQATRQSRADNEVRSIFVCADVQILMVSVVDTGQDEEESEEDRPAGEEDLEISD